MIRLDTDLVVQRVSNFEEMARCRMEFRFARFSRFPGESGAFLRKGVVLKGGAENYSTWMCWFHAETCSTCS